MEKAKYKIKKVDIAYYVCLFVILNEAFLSCWTSSFLSFGNQINTLIRLLALAGFSYVQFLKYNNKKGLKMLPVLFALAMSAEFLLGAKVNQSFYLSLQYVIVVLFFLFASIRNDWEKCFQKIMLASGVVYVISTIYCYIKGIGYLPFVNDAFAGKTGIAGITNHYSLNGIMLVNALIVFFPIFLLEEKNKRKNSIYLALILVALVFCNKRAHFLFGLIAVLCAYLVYTYKDKNKYFKYILFITLGLIIYVVLMNTSTSFKTLIGRFSDMSQDDNLTGRYYYWGIALGTFMNNKLTGTGWLTTRILMEHDVHNTYIQILSELGILGAIILYGFFMYSFFCTIKSFMFVSKNKNRIIRFNIIMTMFSFSYQLFFLMYCITGNPLNDFYTNTVYFSSAAIGICEYYRQKRDRLLN